jgi:hypothetical protein
MKNSRLWILGLTWSAEHHGVLWSTDGHLLNWPHWIKRLIVTTVNASCCRWYGHNRMLEGIVETYGRDGSFRCIMCRAKLWPKTDTP